MVLNIAAYHFAAIDDADALAATLRERVADTALRGTILVAPEGVNLFLAGDEAEVEAFVDALREDARFAGIAVKRSWSEAQPFARLKVKRKREIIAFRRDDASPLQGRAPALAPATLARWLERGRDDDGRRVVLLDTRNRCEVEHGAFAGATTLPIDRFTDLPAAMDAMRDLCRERFEQFGAAGNASKIKVIPLAEMARRYRAGALDPQIGNMNAAA